VALLYMIAGVGDGWVKEDVDWKTKGPVANLTSLTRV